MSSSTRSPITSLSEAAAYLEGLINHERRSDFSAARMDLRPIRALLDGLDHPEARLSVIHVAGSKGKGSTCLLAESILLELGEHVGTFTSPHLESWVERFRIDGAPVAEARLAAAVERVRPVVDALRSGPPESVPSFFDATTAVAFLIFAEAGVDRALIEVGLGGRLDSTNVVAPAVTCITSIELEHTEKLGNTEAEIAGEKAGILKSGVPAVLGRFRADAERVIRARAQLVGAPIYAAAPSLEPSAPSTAGRTRTNTPANSPASMPEGAPESVSAESRWQPIDFELATPGVAARENAALARACVAALDQYPPETLARAARIALSQCRLPARIERLSSDPRVIVDAAHTAESARVLAEALVDLAPDGFDLLLSVSSDKNLDALLGALLPRAMRVWVTRADPLRSFEPERLEKEIRARDPLIRVDRIEDPAQATRLAQDALATSGCLVATGSVYLAGIARRVIGQIAKAAPGSGQA